MKKAFSLALLAATAVVAQQANSGSNPVSDTVREALAGRARNMTAAAEAMPADKYSYKPTEQQMTFAALMEHTIKSNNLLCSKLANQAQPAFSGSDKSPKDKLVEELKRSFDYCEKALSGVHDSQLGEKVTLFGGKESPKAAALIGLASGWSDHYGTAAMYLRLNGILPPTAQKTQSAKE